MTSSRTLSLGLLILFGAFLQAQEEQVEPLRTGIVVTSSSGQDGVRVLTTNSFQGGGLLPMMGGGFDSPSNWLRNPQVQKELGLLAEQMDKIRDLQAAAGKKRSEMIRTLGDVDAEKRTEFLKEMQQVIREDTEKEIKKILLPHQSKRLEEVALQMHLRRSGHRALNNKKLVEMLGLTEKQVKELRDKQQEIQKRMAAEMARLRKEAEEEMMSVLTPAQRKKLEASTGKKYEAASGAKGLPGVLRGLPGAAPIRISR